jgi:hypothetical protein
LGSFGVRSGNVTWMSVQMAEQEGKRLELPKQMWLTVRFAIIFSSSVGIDVPQTLIARAGKVIE